MGCVSRVVLRPLWVPTLISQTKCCAEKFQLNVVPLAERQMCVATASHIQRAGDIAGAFIELNDSILDHDNRAFEKPSGSSGNWRQGSDSAEKVFVCSPLVDGGEVLRRVRGVGAELKREREGRGRHFFLTCVEGF
jgi:hypothetical protein